jgi:hypothetical protein
MVIINRFCQKVNININIINIDIDIINNLSLETTAGLTPAVPRLYFLTEPSLNSKIFAYGR